MCGICGIVCASDERPDEAMLRRMADQIRHRGPDDEGIVVAGRAGIAARRLSIIDVAGGHQPIPNEDETVWCASNGEIYNYPELMDDLRRRGHQFRTRCDTEVVVHLYEEFGLEFLDRLDGMFGLVIWDRRNDRVILGRDRLGIKPLYYADLGDRLLFGSELKALLPAGLPRDLDLAALDAYLGLTYVPAPHTIFRKARKLLPGHYLEWRRDEPIRTAPYWTLPVVDPTVADGRSVDDLAVELRELLRAAVRRHLISDVPLGAFLSGGLDSSAVVALMAQEAQGPVRTFSIGFEERSYDESPYARQVAQHFGTEHHELVPRPDPRGMAEKLAWMYDEPFADSSAIPTYYLASLAREQVKVALTGDGGDEVFGGYVIYRADKMRAIYQHLPAAVRNEIMPAVAARLPSSERKASFDLKLKRFVRAGSLPPVAAHVGWRTLFDHDARRQLLPDAPPVDLATDLVQQYVRAEPPERILDGLLRSDMLSSLPDDMLTKVDRATMAVSLEARVPLLDRAVVEFMARLPLSYKVHGWTLKYLMKRAVEGLVPAEIVHRKKAGFNAPIARWMRDDLHDLVMDALSPAAVAAVGVFDPMAVQETIDQHMQRRADRGRDLWTLLTFMLWHDRYMRVPQSDDPGVIADTMVAAP